MTGRNVYNVYCAKRLLKSYTSEVNAMCKCHVGRRAVSDMKYAKMVAAISGWGDCKIFFLFGFFSVFSKLL